MASNMRPITSLEVQAARGLRHKPGQTLHHPGLTAVSVVRYCPHLYRKQFLQTTASHRFFDIRIQSSWGSGPNSSASPEAASGTRWWSGGDTDSPSNQDQITEGSYSSTQARFANLFNNNKEGSSSGNTNGSGHYSNGSSANSSSHGQLTAATAAPWVAAALLPTIVWCLTWSLTGGMITLTNTCMSGMTSIAQLLFPNLPVRGVDYEDIAVSLVKALHTNTDSPATWTRAGLWAPGWLMRACMGTMFNLATASSSVAAALIPIPQWLSVSGMSQSLMYFTCLLLMLPLGAGFSHLAQQAALLARKCQLSMPKITLPKLPISLPSLNDTTVLALKLAGLLAWPCISAAAVLQPVVQAQGSTAGLTTAAAQVSVCTLGLVLLLTLAVTAGKFAVGVVRQRAHTIAVEEFGLKVGLLCAAQGVLNLGQIGLGLSSGYLDATQLAIPLLSTFILLRVVWSIWRLYRIGSAPPAMWLQLLTLTPNLKPPQPATSSS